MLHPVPYRPEHMLALRVQEQQAWLAPLMTDDVLAGLEGPHTYTLMDDIVPMICAGAIAIEPHRAHLWSMISADIGVWRFAAASGLAKLWLDALPFRRLEAAIDCDFEQGHRWARALGFELEAERMRGYRADGADCALYARLKAV